MSLAALARVLI